MSRRVALIDSCGLWPGAVEAASFRSLGTAIERGPPVADPTGHGSRIAELLCDGDESVELLLGQVFLGAAPTSAAAVAAALDWTTARGARLIHLSLGLAADRLVLRTAVARALAGGAILVAAAPARGMAVYPAAYPGVIRATGDARCGPGELSHLGEAHFGGCPRLSSSAADGGSPDAARGGASIGAAWVSKAILQLVEAATPEAALYGLSARSIYHGPERVRGRAESTVSADGGPNPVSRRSR